MPEAKHRPGWATSDWSGMPPVTPWPYGPQWSAQYGAASRSSALRVRPMRSVVVGTPTEECARTPGS